MKVLFLPLVVVNFNAVAYTDKFYSDGSGSSSDWGILGFIIVVPIVILFINAFLGHPLHDQIEKTKWKKKLNKEVDEREAQEKKEKEEKYKLESIASERDRRMSELQRRASMTPFYKENLIKESIKEVQHGYFVYPKGAKPYNEFPYDAVLDDGTKIYWANGWYYEDTYEEYEYEG
jgi:hypothetical protein